MALVLMRSSFLSSYLSALPLNNKFPNPNTKKIYNKFPNQLRGKKKKINPLHGCYRQCAKRKGGKKQGGRMTEGELCESVECSGKNKEQKRVKEKKRKERKKRKE